MPLLKERTFYKPMEYPWAFEAFKLQNQVHWLPQEVSLKDDVFDWNKNLSEQERYLLSQIFRFFTQGDCFSSDTEVLTSKGWVLFSSLKKHLNEGVKVAQFDKELNITFSYPMRYIEKEYEGDMYCIRDGKQRTNQLITPNHKAIFFYKGEQKALPIEAIKWYQGRKIATSGLKKGVRTKLTPFERLLIAFQADGNVKNDADGSRIGHIKHRFGFSKERKIKRLIDILERSGHVYTVFHKKVEGLSEQSNPNYTYIEVQIEEGKLPKDFSWVNLEEVSSEWVFDFIEELSHWDSHIYKNGTIEYYTSDKKSADIVHCLCVIGGIDHSHTVSEDRRQERYKDIHKISIRTNRQGFVDGQAIHRSSYIQEYSGKVYCVTMPLGTVITRRKNKVAFSGNCDVAAGYINNYLPVFKPVEIRMMLSTFAAMEAVHIHAYSLLLDTIGMDEKEYRAFAEYEEMSAKHEYVHQFNTRSKGNIAKSLAVYSAFTEGLMLFSSFAILLNFPRHGKMTGMGQIVQWSIRDETIHVNNMIKLFRAFIEEHPRVWTKTLQQEIRDIAKKMVELEDKFIDLCFAKGPLENLTAEEVKQYIRYICDRRLIQLGLKGIFNARDNPLPWLDWVISGVEHTNFFENRSTAYSKGTLSDDWGDVFPSANGLDT